MIIFFDGDRTIWNPTYDYEDCYKDLQELLSERYSIDFPLDMIQTSVRAYLKYENKKCNFHRSVFPSCIMRAFNAIYLNEKGNVPNVDQLVEAYRIGERVYDSCPSVKSNFEGIINDINENISKDIFMLTAGDNMVQASKIYNTDTYKNFKEIKIVPYKNEKTYIDCRNELKGKYPGSTFVMIGDSIERDINPAIEAGWYAIHIPSDKKEDVDISESDKAFEAKDLSEVPDILTKISLQEVFGVVTIGGKTA